MFFCWSLLLIVCCCCLYVDGVVDRHSLCCVIVDFSCDLCIDGVVCFCWSCVECCRFRCCVGIGCRCCWLLLVLSCVVTFGWQSLVLFVVSVCPSHGFIGLSPSGMLGHSCFHAFDGCGPGFVLRLDSPKTA